MLTEEEQLEFSKLFKMLLEIREHKKLGGFFQSHFNLHYTYIMDRIKVLSERETFDDNINQNKGEKYAK